MTDKMFDDIKRICDKCETLEEFLNSEEMLKYGDPVKCREQYKYLYDSAKSKIDTWEIVKSLKSCNSFRIDKIQKKENLTINQIRELIINNQDKEYSRVIINLENKDYENLESLLGLGVDIKLNVKNDSGLCSIEEFLLMRSYFNFFKDSIKNYNLSQLEKIMLAYNYVKFFNFNLGEDKRNTDSRSIVKAINTGNIVCQGYSNIFSQLLLELDIESYLEYISPNEKEPGGHVRNIIYVNDEKYNISEPAVFDVTWDSNKDMVFYAKGDQFSYESEKFLDDNTNIIERLPSMINFLFFMVPIMEYYKYFPNDEIESIEQYSSKKKVDTSSITQIKDEVDAKTPRERDILNYLPDLLSVTMRVMGYSKSQIDNYTQHAINILYQTRFGHMDKYANKRAQHM